MASILHFFILLPLLGFGVSMLIPVKEETLLSRSAFFVVGLHMIAAQT
jgi:hypothetical protein